MQKLSFSLRRGTGGILTTWPRSSRWTGGHHQVSQRFNLVGHYSCLKHLSMFMSGRWFLVNQTIKEWVSRLVEAKKLSAVWVFQWDGQLAWQKRDCHCSCQVFASCSSGGWCCKVRTNDKEKSTLKGLMLQSKKGNKWKWFPAFLYGRAWQPYVWYILYDLIYLAIENSLYQLMFWKESFILISTASGENWFTLLAAREEGPQQKTGGWMIIEVVLQYWLFWWRWF